MPKQYQPSIQYIRRAQETVFVQCSITVMIVIKNHTYNLFRSPLAHARGKRPHLSYPTIAVYMPDGPSQ